MAINENAKFSVPVINCRYITIEEKRCDRLAKKEPLIGGKGKQVWVGHPSVSVFYALYGIVAAIVLAVLVGGELWVAGYGSIGRILLPRNLVVGGVRIPYPVEAFTVAIILFAYLVEVIRLALLRVRHKYELREDGLYFDSGIVNLQNTFVAPMAFSDARLDMPLSLRLIRRGNIIVDTNDSRHFKLQIIQDPLTVQNLIRRTLGHPVVRIESPSSP